MNSVSSSTNSHSFQFTSSASTKYDGLIEESLLTTVKSSISSLFTSPYFQNLGLSIIPYIVIIYYMFNTSSFIDEMNQILVLAGCVFSILHIGISYYYLINSRIYGEDEIIMVIAIFILSFIVSMVIIKRKRIQCLKLLDLFEETNNIESFGGIRNFRLVLIPGFANCHPTCLNYSIFEAAVEEWPDSIGIWALFAKYSAIYPEKATVMMFICQSIINSKFHSSFADEIIDEISEIMKIRERNITPYLKSMIAKISKLTSKAKNKLRNIWDLVLQYNLNELESAIVVAKQTTKEAEYEIEHMMDHFPNNRFAARIYARFFHDVRADSKMFIKWKDNVSTLQKGGMINEDPVQYLGLRAFPFLPNSVSDVATLSGQTEDFTDEFVSEDKDEDNIHIAEMIDNQNIWSVSFIKSSTIEVLILTVIIPTIVLLCIYQSYETKIMKPLEIMHGISFLRILMNMIASLTCNYLTTTIADPNDPTQSLMRKMDFNDDINLTTLGYKYTAKEMVSYIIREVPVASGLLDKMRDFETGNSFVDEARQIVFGDETKFIVYQVSGFPTEYKISIELAITKLATYASKVIDFQTIDKTTLFNENVKTVLNNNEVATNNMNIALERIIDYIKESDAKSKVLYQTVCIVLILSMIISHLIVFTIQNEKLTSQKHGIFEAMALLPKTVISSVSAGFCSIRKDKEATISTTTDGLNSETNKQEESAIKIIHSISESKGERSELIAIYLMLILIISGAIILYFICRGHINVSNIIVESCPHIDYLLGCSAYLYSLFVKISQISIDQYHSDFSGFCLDINESIKEIHTGLLNLVKYWNLLRFGGSGKAENSFIGMKESLKNANDIIVCENSFKPPTSFYEGASCFDSEGITYFAITFLKKFYSEFQENSYVKPRGENLGQMWQVSAVMQYESFFYPSGMKIVDTIKNSVDKEFPKMLGISVGLMIVSIIISFVILYLSNIEEETIRFTLRLFLFCPPKAIYNCPQVMALFKNEKVKAVDDKTQRDSSFYNSVISKLNDMIIISNSETNMIIDANVAFENMFSVNKEDIIGKNIKEFFDASKFEGVTNDIFHKQCNIVATIKGEKMYVSTSVMSINGNTVIIGRNETERVKHKTLIIDERKKSDSLLSCILPPLLVPRVQSGEQNISFAVQSVSVLFLDIIGFTPWCGSNEAAYVMKILNKIFEAMDSSISKYKTLSKIKCIGDCYMCAGGIFDEVNQPAMHAKEMTEFGVQAIKNIVDINTTFNETLKIRVGVNTGGPIVAGVLGVDKPTFEILGPTINIAQQMEHHGVPMMVHISRPVYELIYGSNLNVKERGEIDIKNGKMFTYLIDPMI